MRLSCNSSKTIGNFDVHLLEDVLLRTEKENEYYTLLSSGREPKFLHDRAGKIAMVTNAREKPERIFEKKLLSYKDTAILYRDL